MRADGDATLTDSNGSWKNLSVNGSFNASGGILAGESLTAASVSLRNASASTSLSLRTLAFADSLPVAAHSTLKTSNLATATGRVSLIEGSSLETSSFGSQARPIASLTMSGDSILAGENGIGIKRLDATDSRLITTSGDMGIAGPEINISGSSLTVEAGNLSFSGQTLAPDSGLTASKDILIYGTISDNRANTLKINAGDDIIARDSIHAGEIKARKNIWGTSATAKNITAKAAALSGDLRVENGALSLKSTSYAKNLILDSSKFTFNAMRLTCEASFLNSSGSFASIKDAKYNQSGGDITGTSLNTRLASIVDEGILSLENLDFANNLIINSATLKAASVNSESGSISAINGARLEARTLGSENSPIPSLLLPESQLWRQPAVSGLKI